MSDRLTMRPFTYRKSMIPGLPLWLARRLPYLKKTGKFSVASETQFDQSYLSQPEIARVLAITRHLDLSRTQVTSLQDFPAFPRVNTFVADHSGLADFKNFSILKTATTFSLRDTPVSKLPTYRLSLLLAVGVDSIASIDGVQISAKLKERVSSYPKICSDFVNRGWIADAKVPDRARMRDLVRQFSVDSDEDFEDDDEAVPSLKAKTDEADLESLDFESLLARMMAEHEDVLSRGQGIFGIIDDEGLDLSDRLVSMIHSHGIPLPDNSDDAIVATVERLVSETPKKAADFQ
jgi:hypothetical protein